jgi:signal transduction histidine kinase/CheY-like chemotaxis protein
MMLGTLPPLAGDTRDEQSLGRTLRNMLRAMWVVAVAACLGGLLEPKNDWRATLAVYGVTFLALLGFGALLRRKRFKAAGLALAIFIWLLVAFVTLFFGGLKGENASVFAVGILLVGTVGSGRAAVWMALSAALWCGLVAVLEVTGRSPAQLGSYSPINAWSAITVALVLMSVLLRASINSLRDLHTRALANADERDAALRRSIQAQKMQLVGSVASGIAHDFNNLLMVIGGAAQLLRPRLPADDREASASLDDLDAATVRATLMARHLLAFGRAKGVEVGVVDLGAVVSAFEPMIPRLLGSTIAVVVTATTSLPVRATRAGLEQILLNLAVNARDAMPNGGTLRISATLDALGARCLLAVSDTGVGMDAETQARIFEPFFTTKATGTGLGLATLHDLVLDFGGTVLVRSVLGAGTTFEVRFAVVDAAVTTAPALEPAAPAAGGRGGRVLVVDDDAMVRRVTARLLTPMFEVVTVASGLEALALLAQAKDFACVVSDISMPLLDGEALAAQLARERPELPVVLLSGMRTQLAPTSDAARPVFLEKPTNRETLLAAIAEAKSRAQARMPPEPSQSAAAVR